MNWKKLAPLAAAIVLGLIAARMAAGLTGRKPTASAVAPPPQKGRDFVVTTHDIEPGVTLMPTDLTLSTAAPPVPASNGFRDATLLVGRVTSAMIPASQPVTRAALADGLQAVIPAGMRAITLEVNETSGVANNLTPGCHVDVIQTLPDRSSGEPVARTITQDVEVSAIGMRQRPAPDANNISASTGDLPVPHSVTLLVSPAQAELLELATRSGTPRFALRKAGDHSTIQTPGVTLADLRGRVHAELIAPRPVQYAPPPPAPVTQPVAPPAKADDAWTIQVIRGGAESDVRFPVHKPAAVTKTDLEPIGR